MCTIPRQQSLHNVSVFNWKVEEETEQTEGRRREGRVKGLKVRSLSSFLTLGENKDTRRKWSRCTAAERVHSRCFSLFEKKKRRDTEDEQSLWLGKRAPVRFRQKTQSIDCVVGISLPIGYRASLCCTVRRKWGGGMTIDDDDDEALWGPTSALIGF